MQVLPRTEAGDPSGQIRHHPAFGVRTRMSLMFSSLSVEMVAPCPVPGGATTRLIRGFFVLRGELGNTDTLSTCATHKAMGADAC